MGRRKRWEEGARATSIKIGDIERTQYTRTIRNGKLENPALRPLMFLVGTQQPVPSSALFCRCYKEATHCIGRSMEGKHLRRKSFFCYALRPIHPPHPRTKLGRWAEGIKTQFSLLLLPAE